MSHFSGELEDKGESVLGDLINASKCLFVRGLSVTEIAGQTGLSGSDVITDGMWRMPLSWGVATSRGK